MIGLLLWLQGGGTAALGVVLSAAGLLGGFIAAAVRPS